MARISNATTGAQLATNARLATSHWARLAGLLGRGSLDEGEALIIRPCTSVHTMFMRFTIDVVFIDDKGAVVKAVERLRPFRASLGGKGARAAVELPAGVIEGSGTAAGHQLAIAD
jgi:uncharacterized membrane protein (UPF0127 family)